MYKFLASIRDCEAKATGKRAAWRLLFVRQEQTAWQAFRGPSTSEPEVERCLPSALEKLVAVLAPCHYSAICFVVQSSHLKCLWHEKLFLRIWKAFQNTIEKSQLRKWEEHFTTTLNRDDLGNPPCLEVNIPELNINLDAITRDEIWKVISQLKNGKLPGYDEILVKLLLLWCSSSCLSTYGRRIRFWITGTEILWWKQLFNHTLEDFQGRTDAIQHRQKPKSSKLWVMKSW